MLCCGDSWTDYSSGDEYPNYLPASWDVVNSGSGGTAFAAASAGGSLEGRITSEMQAEADSDFVLINTAGANDVSFVNQSAAVLQTAVQSVYDLVLAENMRPIFASIPIVGTWSADRKVTANAMEAWLATFCADRNLPFVPLIKLVCDGDNGIRAEYEGPNNSHLNTLGVQVVANAFTSAVRCSMYRQAAVA